MVHVRQCSNMKKTHDPDSLNLLSTNLQSNSVVTVDNFWLPILCELTECCCEIFLFSNEGKCIAKQAFGDKQLPRLDLVLHKHH